MAIISHPAKERQRSPPTAENTKPLPWNSSPKKGIRSFHHAMPFSTLFRSARFGPAAHAGAALVLLSGPLLPVPCGAQDPAQDPVRENKAAGNLAAGRRDVFSYGGAADLRYREADGETTGSYIAATRLQ